MAPVASALAALVVGLVVIAVGLAIYTRLRVRWITRHYPATGEHVGDGTGGVFHVVMAGLDRDGADTRPPVVFLHGALTNLRDLMAPLEAPLADRYRLLFIDRPGLGWSGRRRPGETTPPGQAAAVAAVLARLEMPPAILVGHSYGAAVALALALDCPERVAGLVLLAPASHPWPGGVKRRYHLIANPVAGRAIAETLVLPVADATMDRAVAASFAPGIPPADYVRQCAVPLNTRPRDIRNNARDIVDLETAITAMAPRYPEIAVPAAIVTGDVDAVLWPIIHTEGLRRDLADIEVTTVAGAGHNVQHTATQDVIAAIDRVCERVRAGRAVPMTDRIAAKGG